MNVLNTDRAQVAALGQGEFPFMGAPSFEDARQKAVDFGLEKVRASKCLGTGWGFFGHDANGVAVIVEIYANERRKTSGCPTAMAFSWHNL